MILVINIFTPCDPECNYTVHYLPETYNTAINLNHITEIQLVNTPNDNKIKKLIWIKLLTGKAYLTDYKNYDIIVKSLGLIQGDKLVGY